MGGTGTTSMSPRQGPDSLLGMVAARAAEHPDQRLYSMFESADGPAGSITAATLHRQVLGVGCHLADTLAPGSRVLLLLPPGRAFVLGFLGCVAAGLVPIPAAPPSRARLRQSLLPLARILADCQPRAILSTEALATATMAGIEASDPLLSIPWHRLNDAVRRDAGNWVPPPVDARQPAFLQYTSGSTMAPRGVVVTHANLLANLATIQRAFATTSQDHAVVWLPPHHDMGLVGGLLTPLHGGFAVTLLTPQEFVQSPVRWLRAITQAGGTISGGPDFAYRMCVERVRDDQLDGLDLSSWRLAFTGAEPVSAGTLRAFGERFAPVGFRPSAFYPCYGLAESTLFVSGGVSGRGPTVTPLSRLGLSSGVAATPVDADDVRALVSNGEVVGDDTVLLIVDPQTRTECARGEVGEIWVRGPSVAAGYFGQPDLSRERFAATTAEGDGPYLCTGDLGCLVDGQLYVTGRLKDTLIVDGRTLDAHDVEEAIGPAIHADRQGLTAALSVTASGHERMVVVQEVGRAAVAGAAALTGEIYAVVAERFGVRPDDVVLVPIGSLPRTTSGKLRRAEAARLLLAGELRRLGQGL